MPFDIALSGIRAASSDLEVTGNNIANASTTGFKTSRVEFADVYATSVLGAGLNQTGAGVAIADISQKFTQGNVTFTESQLDMAVNGNGFFVLSNNGDRTFTRSGAFGLDDEGYITANNSARLQGNSADEAGDIVPIISDLRIRSTIIDPRQTTEVTQQLNLNATEDVLQTTGRQFVADGNSVELANVGLRTATTSQLSGSNFTLPLANNFDTNAGGTAATFDVSLFSGTANNGTVSVTLNSLAGVPPTINSFNDLRTLASVINAQLFSPSAPQTQIGVVAEAEDLGAGNYRMNFNAIENGVPSTVTLANQSANTAQLGISGGATNFVQGEAAVSNGYAQQSVDITNPDGDVATYTSNRHATAAQTASELNSILGLTATAETTATLSNFVNTNGNANLTINNVTLTGLTLADIETGINNLTNSTLPGITATLDVNTGFLSVRSAVGDDLRFSISSTDDGDALTIIGDQDSLPAVIETDAAGNGVALANASPAETNSVVVGGQLSITVEDGYSIGNEQPLATGLFQPLGDINDPNSTVFSDAILNEFDPTDSKTYNSATSTTLFDSLGVRHVMTQFFVKQPYDATDPTTSQNHWLMYVQVDGQDIGDPDPANPTVPTRASYNLFFNEDGSLNNLLSEDVLISNWTVLNEDGSPSGALGPLPVLNGGSSAIAEPPTSSNFTIQLAGSTQFGVPFAINDIDQNGFTAGQLSGLSIDESGIISSRFTNGESLILGQVLLADFTNQQGLQPDGDTAWVETFESGTANINQPGTAALGAVQAGALEESNVDLSEQLVQLIIAQRNFQASAKTIETADSTTQTIINLR